MIFVVELIKSKSVSGITSYEITLLKFTVLRLGIEKDLALDDVIHMFRIYMFRRAKPKQSEVFPQISH